MSAVYVYWFGNILSLLLLKRGVLIYYSEQYTDRHVFKSLLETSYFRSVFDSFKQTNQGQRGV